MDRSDGHRFSLIDGKRRDGHGNRRWETWEGARYYCTRKSRARRGNAARRVAEIAQRSGGCAPHADQEKILTDRSDGAIRLSLGGDREDRETEHGDPSAAVLFVVKFPVPASMSIRIQSCDLHDGTARPLRVQPPEAVACRWSHRAPRPPRRFPAPVHHPGVSSRGV